MKVCNTICFPNSSLIHILSIQAELSHELIAGAAAYEVPKAYDKHEAESKSSALTHQLPILSTYSLSFLSIDGQPPSHADAKEMFSTVIGAFVDHTVETKGLDFIDKEVAKEQAHDAYLD
ncbi:hypothetical protein FRB93_012388 [Tulasnella sp. JGI-2019a]|nr:hypothetical protein FRB93_012388 [Tulasnella sp. JGI-2019a]